MTTTGTTLPPPVAQEYAEKMLSTPMQRNIHNLLAIPRYIQGSAGKTLRMRRYNRLPTAPVPVDPLFLNTAPVQLTAVDIDATVRWYTQTVIITREVTAINQDPKKYGVFKFSLIDMEVLEDDMAQAKAA